MPPEDSNEDSDEDSDAENLESTVKVFQTLAKQLERLQQELDAEINAKNDLRVRVLELQKVIDDVEAEKVMLEEKLEFASQTIESMKS